MLIDCFQVYSYPFPNTKYLYVSNYKHSMKEHIRKHARLEIGKATGVQGDEEQVQVVFSIQQAIIFHLYNHALQFGEFSAFSSEQEYYSLKLLHNLHAASKCIISFERCVLTTPGMKYYILL